LRWGEINIIIFGEILCYFFGVFVVLWKKIFVVFGVFAICEEKIFIVLVFLSFLFLAFTKIDFLSLKF
jgi:hypothetical protein